MDESKSESAIINACSLDESESKRVYISVNTSEVKYAMNETKDEEPSVTDNSVINAPSYLKIFECIKNFLKNLDATYEQACMETLQGRWGMVKLSYVRACII